jgi:molybdenum cofactor cytidylyltransferase
MLRSFAIVPAAGRSERMGMHKLLLPLCGRTVIEHVLSAWTESPVTRTTVVVRADDAELLSVCRRFDLDLLAPSAPPPDMKASVRLALAHIEETYHPAANDAWLLAPADMPRLNAGIIARVLRAYESTQPTPVAPMFRGQRGHPMTFAWAQSQDVHTLAASQGVNSLVARTEFRPVDFHGSEILDNINSPADYDRLLAAWETRPGSSDETTRPTPGF